MFHVVACGFPPAPVPGHPASRAVQELPHPVTPEFLGAALDHLLAAEPGVPTLLLHDGSPTSEHRLRVLRSLLGRPPVLPVGLRVPLTGLAATATVAASLAAAGLGAGAVVGSLPTLGAHLPVRAVTRTVARLDRPEIGIAQTMVSFVPGASIRLRFGGERLLIGAAATAPLPLDGPVALVQTGDRRLAGKIGPSPDEATATLDVAGPPPLTAGWWGTRRFFEQCAVPTSVQRLAEEITATRWQRCPECGDAMHQYCRFCSAQEVYA